MPQGEFQMFPATISCRTQAYRNRIHAQVEPGRQSQVHAVQPHCPECSAKHGGLLSAFSKRMKALLGL
ncbi:hypothetical protein DTL21_28160 [Bremerella cremea]|uniref:Uncharacterized protein n=1 Tax=Blastopirellula marina TaxID=124 RepID=A0A2S8F8I7_9BACT|nr:hypothetical protein C5Y83_28115 [Blastopirellula marina]RCS41847.1 hypothetical protein DTL21_28160 [Bremerella cremea]